MSGTENIGAYLSGSIARLPPLFREGLPRKNVFVVGLIEVTNFDHLKILIFDANCQAHSVEIINPQTMRIYDELPGRGFAVSFISGDQSGVETRCYIRDEGEDSDKVHERTALEKITLPQLFEYLEEITAAEPAAKKSKG
jgi:hypothetical protein